MNNSELQRWYQLSSSEQEFVDSEPVEDDVAAAIISHYTDVYSCYESQPAIGYCVIPGEQIDAMVIVIDVIGATINVDLSLGGRNAPVNPVISQSFDLAEPDVFQRVDKTIIHFRNIIAERRLRLRRAVLNETK